MRSRASELEGGAQDPGGKVCASRGRAGVGGAGRGSPAHRAPAEERGERGARRPQLAMVRPPSPRPLPPVVLMLLLLLLLLPPSPLPLAAGECRSAHRPGVQGEGEVRCRRSPGHLPGEGAAASRCTRAEPGELEQEAQGACKGLRSHLTQCAN